MSVAMSASMLRTRLQYFLRDARGVSAVEFALLAPLMITLFLGGADVSQAVNIDRKVAITARTVADLTSRFKKIETEAVMNNILDAATAVTAPYPASKLKVKISSLKIDDKNVVKVVWGRAKNTTARSPGEVVTIPAAWNIKDTFLIWAEVEYDYQPSIGYVITGALTLKNQIYMHPREALAGVVFGS